MRFDLFGLSGDAHLRKARDYLQQAYLSRVEHQLAADHHAALATMYAQRIAWLEQELSNAAGNYSWPTRDSMPAEIEPPRQRSASVISWLRAHNPESVKAP